MTNVDFNDKVIQAEMFGSILSVIEYDNLSDAIGWVKERPHPLSCYVYTEDKTIKNRILREVLFGGGAVNDGVMHITNANLPKYTYKDAFELVEPLYKTLLAKHEAKNLYQLVVMHGGFAPKIL